ncbi:MULTISPECIES: carbohydrate ABC transporter permease [Oceanobacillus]|uniref:ABC transporter permease protein AmyC n=1 Tax=Oceanobacillus kimchii TaxID=746691 RepID=A0ABQ5TN73_9BACI|nr:MULTISPECIES: carbohydrate ABC transporter permease [Oceanobacillus]MBT2600464.1 carbohydrate ABC transporter permease [Oceanobacillus sp. ISL-74]MBT2650622.1 carbohydrate ABC transporter permease [Oceanobacillus sp. ISL-73]GLO67515.1 putative ABC transporter permease protein AmyC [Oceanobacillus kimchii]
MDYISSKRKITLSTFALIFAVLHFLPFYILITTALKTKSDFSSKWVFPTEFSWSNFTEAWQVANLGNALLNTGIITFFAAILLIVIGSLAAYPLARRQTKLNRFMFMFFIAIMVVPPLAALVPLYQLVVNIGLMNTHEVAIFNNVASYLPLTIFLYAGFIRSTIPKSLEEAARIDGAGTFRIFFQIVFPLLKPVTASILIIACVYIWNDYQFAIFFLQDESVQTMTVALSRFFGENANNINLVAAAAIIATLPMAILFLLLQKHFVKGLATGSVKG